MQKTCGKTRLKRVSVIVALVVCAFVLTGCGASLSVYDYTASDGTRYNEYELSISRETLARMEKSAINDLSGKKYTAKSYFYQLFEFYGYNIVSATDDDNGYKAVFRKAVTYTSELDSVCGTVEFTRERVHNGFVATVTSTADNPFNGVRQKYDDVQPNQAATVLQQLKNGRVSIDEYGDVKVDLPSVIAAFPYLQTVDMSGFLLNYGRIETVRAKSSGIAYAQSDGDTAVYVFPRYFDYTETQIQIITKRAVSYGWYAVALAAGLATVAIIAIITREKRQKTTPTLLDRFPYNPEEYRDYNSYLPQKRDK